MQTALVTYTERLTPHELDYLKGKERSERKMYFKIFRILMVVCFVMPFIGAWYRAYDGAPNAFSYSRFFVSAGALLFISFFATFFTYRYNLRLVQKDIARMTKTIEQSRIQRKLHVAQNDTYHFYLNSATQLSIEVSASDFAHLREGDEVCIEYFTYSREYIGYF